MKQRNDEATPYIEEDETGLMLGHIELVKVQRDFAPLYAGKYGKSLGAMVDEAVANAVQRGDELQDFNLHFERETWSNVARFYSSGRA